MSFELEMEQELAQSLNQFQMQSLNILAFDNYEMEQFLQNEFAENPMLEYQPSRKEFFTKRGSVSRAEETSRQEIADKASKDPKSFFMEQLNSEDYSKEEWKILDYMAQCLDESGLLKVKLSDIADWFQVSLDQVERLRKEMTKLEPSGVFAVSLQECLILQMERSKTLNETLRSMIEDHLEDIALGRLSTISRALHISTAQVRKNIFAIQQLNPRPFSAYSQGMAEYIVPDIVIEYKEPEDIKIYLNDHWIGDYSINDYYVKMMEQAQDSELKEYFRKKYERCRWILDSIEQRRETLIQISKAIFMRQREFLLMGKPLKPMTMQNIADDIKMHVSTISRAVKGKYMQYPYGTVGLRDIFAASYAFGNQENTVEDIKKEIRNIIEAEDSKKPLSDSKIARELEKKEIKISRRTVAKYRVKMGIGGVHERKDL